MLIDQRGNPIKVVLRALRYGTTVDQECDTVEQALTYAYRDVEECYASPMAILVDGVIKYDADALEADRFKRDRETYAAVLPKRALTE